MLRHTNKGCFAGLIFDVEAILRTSPHGRDGIAIRRARRIADARPPSPTPSRRDAAAAVEPRNSTPAAARNAEDIVVQCRAALADLLNADPDEVIFGRSMTALTFDCRARWPPVGPRRRGRGDAARPRRQRAAVGDRRRRGGRRVRWVGLRPRHLRAARPASRRS